MDDKAKDNVVANILKKEFNLKSNDVDDLREQCLTLKKFNRVIKGKVNGNGSEAHKKDLIGEINTLIREITTRIDELKK